MKVLNTLTSIIVKVNNNEKHQINKLRDGITVFLQLLFSIILKLYTVYIHVFYLYFDKLQVIYSPTLEYVVYE